MKFRKKPIVIEAEQWFEPGDSPKVHEPSPEEYDTLNLLPRIFDGGGPFGIIQTLEGPHIVSPGDWIIKGIAGEYYPCKPDIFDATYEPMEGV